MTILIARHAGVDAERFEQMDPYWQNRYRASFYAHNRADARIAADRRWADDFNRQHGHV